MMGDVKECDDDGDDGKYKSLSIWQERIIMDDAPSALGQSRKFGKNELQLFFSALTMSPKSG